jgi:hypothetical protein
LVSSALQRNLGGGTIHPVRKTGVKQANEKKEFSSV